MIPEEQQVKSQKRLICSGKATLKCKLGEEEFTPLPPDNVVFDQATLNNLSRIRNHFDRKSGYYIEIEADDDSFIVCEEKFGDKGLELACKAIGERTPDFYEIYENITDLDEMYEPPEEVREYAYKLFEQVIENHFPDMKEKLDYLKPFAVPKLKKYGAHSVRKAWIDESGRVYNLYIGYDPDEFENIDESPYMQQQFILDTIHELTHAVRVLDERFSIETGVEEGETYTESLIRGDMVIRVKYPFPHGEVEEVVYAKRCILPKQYCFETLGEARDFEEFNYELVSGEEKPRPLDPTTTPDWDEIVARIPIAPIVDMMRGMKGSYNVLTDVKEYWIEVTSPNGKKYLYTLADLHVDHRALSFVEAIETIDELDAKTGDEDIESVKDFP